MNSDRQVPIGTLVANGLSEQEAKTLCENKATVAWVDLARTDGTLALAVLTPEEFDGITDVIVKKGVPREQVQTPEGLVEVLIAFARSQSPAGTWYNHSLTSAVACAALLCLVQEAEGYTEVQTKEAKIANFAAKLGVKIDEGKNDGIIH